MLEDKKFSIELKQTAKKEWYLGSLKIDSNDFNEIELLIDSCTKKIINKLNKLNNTQSKNTKEPQEEIILSPEQEALFEHLKKIRREISDKENYPPYILFHDSILKKLPHADQCDN